ncbi:TldD/PmbA family protein [Marine Group I thaumarchaeote]|uniref:TldD/PmbA family protein n=1 Tax=Marine Group I thaumarchaeote TaxID=2511932 RepID=A0A7K4MGS6_9ARCH|nr:MAG: TldD/PmbA family protein [Nitrosopumilus sp. YT1]NMI81575.1 TldD/PmbA family protein [Candidatus Nitrosopumilus sp. MTA1]NWJ19509.1 TldD/PmbA family protein [Marine Group I thaumarchaeote]NWJ28411.1 TldD/PmbA family protein [Marine Group I thaumarchaeote]NWJ56921.1 TldD/PmbA family protein [Marine Group I thaumarchaeote]
MSALDKALNHSKNIGINECEIVIVKKKIITIRITDSEIAEIKQNFSEDYGIRLIHDKKIASIQTTNQQDIEKAIDSAFKTSSNLKARDFWGGLPHDTTLKQLDRTFDERLEKISGVEVMDIVQNMINSANSDKVNTITGSLNIVSENFEIANSNGLHLNEKATYISGIINAESEYGTLPVSGIGHASGRTLSNFSAEQVGKDAKIMCIESINPQKIDSDNYSIIFEPYSVGELLAFVVAANFNFKTFSEKKSCFSNNFEERIAIEKLSLIDDPHIPEGIGTKSVDDEGTETKKRNLIEKGIFKNTFSNLFDSYKEGKQSSGNASRSGSPMGRSSEPIPMSAPHNLKINPGDISQEDMIKDTKHGLLVGRLWYTYAVNPIKGDFSCTARSGIRIIENGEIKGPGKSVRIIHNLPTMLKNISEIGNNPKNVIQWASLPSIVPTLKAENIMVNSI